MGVRLQISIGFTPAMLAITMTPPATGEIVSTRPSAEFPGTSGRAPSRGATASLLFDRQRYDWFQPTRPRGRDTAKGVFTAPPASSFSEPMQIQREFVSSRAYFATDLSAEPLNQFARTSGQQAAFRTSPHTWGTGIIVRFTALFRRHIPTRVGNSPAVR